MDLFLKNQPPNHRNIKHFFVCFLKPRLTKLLLSLFPGAFIRKPSQILSQWCRLTLTVNNTRLEVQCRAQVLSVWFSGFTFGVYYQPECQCCLCGGEEMLSPHRYCLVFTCWDQMLVQGFGQKYFSCAVKKQFIWEEWLGGYHRVCLNLHGCQGRCPSTKPLFNSGKGMAVVKGSSSYSYLQEGLVCD